MATGWGESHRKYPCRSCKYTIPEGILAQTWQPNVKATYWHKFRVTFSKPSCVVLFEQNRYDMYGVYLQTTVFLEFSLTENCSKFLPLRQVKSKCLESSILCQWTEEESANVRNIELHKPRRMNKNLRAENMVRVLYLTRNRQKQAKKEWNSEKTWFSWIYTYILYW